MRLSGQRVRRCGQLLVCRKCGSQDIRGSFDFLFFPDFFLFQGFKKQSAKRYVGRRYTRYSLSFSLSLSFLLFFLKRGRWQTQETTAQKVFRSPIHPRFLFVLSLSLSFLPFFLKRGRWQNPKPQRKKVCRSPIHPLFPLVLSLSLCRYTHAHTA